MVNVNVDFSDIVGKIKPMHGVNGGPRTVAFTYDSTALFQEIGIPYSRLHDVEYPYGSGEFVDIHCVFKNFEADENDPASYNFALTDHYIKACLDAGAEVIYRLGESIEHAPVKRYIYPPRDYAKWARICEHIIRHYNEGWADGFAWHIRYWEIWNEPDLAYDDESKKTWTGTEEQFYDFFETVAKHLKSKFPQLRIGGPAVAGRKEWAERFLLAMRRRNVPMDFFSWHKYSDKIEAYIENAKFYEDLKTRLGYADSETILDEWNYMENWNMQAPSFKKLVGIRGAAYCMANLITMQHLPIDLATYFEADVVKEWCGLFEVKDMSIDSLSHKDSKCVLKPRKPFYAFRAFGELYRLGLEAKSSSDSDSVYICAATDGKVQKAVVSTYRSDGGDCSVTLSGLGKHPTVKIYLTDETSTDTCIQTYEFAGDRADFTLDAKQDSIYTLEVEYLR